MNFNIQGPIRENKIEILGELFDQNPELLNAEFRGGYNRATPLHYAVENGSAEMVKFLVDRGANLDAKLQLNYNRCHAKLRSREQNYRGPTSLELAVALKKYDSVAVLLESMRSKSDAVGTNLNKILDIHKKIEKYTEVSNDLEKILQDKVGTTDLNKILGIHKKIEKYYDSAAVLLESVCSAKGYEVCMTDLNEIKKVRDDLDKIGQIEYKYLEQKSNQYHESLDLKPKILGKPISNILSFFKATDIDSLAQAYEFSDPFIPFIMPSYLIGQNEQVVDSSIEGGGGGR